MDVAEGRIDATPLVSASQKSDESAGAKPLEIPLLEVQPMDKIEFRSQSERALNDSRRDEASLCCTRKYQTTRNRSKR